MGVHFTHGELYSFLFELRVTLPVQWLVALEGDGYGLVIACVLNGFDVKGFAGKGVRRRGGDGEAGEDALWGFTCKGGNYGNMVANEGCLSYHTVTVAQLEFLREVLCGRILVASHNLCALRREVAVKGAYGEAVTGTKINESVESDGFCIVVRGFPVQGFVPVTSLHVLANFALVTHVGSGTTLNHDGLAVLPAVEGVMVPVSQEFLEVTRCFIFMVEDDASGACAIQFRDADAIRVFDVNRSVGVEALYPSLAGRLYPYRKPK